MSRDLMFEIGVEELPAGYVPPALEQLARGVREGLEVSRLGFGGARTFGTPRRLTVLVHRVEERQADFDEEALRKCRVLADPDERRRTLVEQIVAAAAERGGRVVADDELTDIVNYLIEWPTAVTGGFAERYLELPREVIVTALREHQRFF